MYTFYIDIGSWEAPEVGSGYIHCNPRYEECALEKEKEGEKIFSRIKLNGDLTFVGAEYDALKLLSATETQVHLKIYVNIFLLRSTSYLQLQGQYDVDSKQASLQVQTEDKYVKVMAGMAEELNITLQQKHSVQLPAATYLDQFYEAKQSGSGWVGKTNYLNCGEDPLINWTWYPSYNYVAATATGDSYQGEQFSFCKDPYSSVVYACIQDNIGKNPFDNPSYWAVCTDIMAGVTTFSQERANQNFPGSTYDDESGLWVLANCTSRVYPFILTRNIKLYDVLKAMLTKIDPTILITDNIITGGVNIYAPYLIADPELNHIFIADKSDIKYPSSSNPATYEIIKFEQILEIYKWMFNLDWKINNNGYFQFVHPTEYAKTLPLETVKPLHFLTTVISRNWTKDRMLYKLEEAAKIHKEIWLFEKSNSWDFDGVPIVYYNDNKSDSTYSLEYVNCNIAKIMSVGGLASDSGFALIAGIWVSDHYEIADKLDRYGQTLINGKLAASWLITEHHITGGRAYVKGNVNEVENVALVTGNNKEVPDLIVPSQDIDAIDFDYLIETDLGNLEAVSYTVKMNGELAKLKCKFK